MNSGVIDGELSNMASRLLGVTRSQLLLFTFLLGTFGLLSHFNLHGSWTAEILKTEVLQVRPEKLQPDLLLLIIRS